MEIETSQEVQSWHEHEDGSIVEDSRTIEACLKVKGRKLEASIVVACLSEEIEESVESILFVRLASAVAPGDLLV